MFPGINPKDLQKAMKKMGIKQEEVDATEVIIKCTDKDIIIPNPQVSKVNMMGQETWQIVGEAHEVAAGSVAITPEDIDTVMNQTGTTKEKAKKALEENNGDIAAAILDIGSK